MRLKEKARIFNPGLAVRRLGKILIIWSMFLSAKSCNPGSSPGQAFAEHALCGFFSGGLFLGLFAGGLGALGVLGEKFGELLH